MIGLMRLGTDFFPQKKHPRLTEKKSGDYV